jgi:hypothetical protein
MDFTKLSDAELEAIAGGGQPAAPAGPDFSSMSDAELEAIAGGGAPAPAAAADQSPTMGALAGAYGRIQGLGARAAIHGGLTGLAAPATLGIDAATNAAYGLHKLAAKTGAVSEPDADRYYGKGRGYFPLTSDFSEGVSELEDKAGLPKPESATERVLSAVGEGAVGGVGGAAAGRILPGAVGRSLAAQPVVQGFAGAAGGGAQQGATEAGANPTTAAVLGMVAGAATGAAGAKVAQAPRAAVPTTDEIRGAKSAAYQRSEAAGVQFTPDAIRDLDQTVRQRLRQANVFVDTKSEARDVLDPLTRSHMPDASGQRSPVSLARVDDIRQQASALRGSSNASERRTGRILAESVDEWLDNVDARHLTRNSGDVTEGLSALREGQGLNRRLAKATALDRALTTAEDRAGSTGSGANSQNAVRQNLRPALDPKSSLYRQFDPAERDAIRGVVRGDALTNSTRMLGKLAPTGAVSGLFTLGAAASGYGFLPAAGIAGKVASEALQGRKVRNLERLVKGGPGAVRRPSARVGANAGRGALRGFLAGPSSYQDDPGASARYR